jgi:chromate transporter
VAREAGPLPNPPPWPRGRKRARGAGWGPAPTPAGVPRSTFAEIFRIFLRLGLTSFGGPVAHLGYFRAEFVAKRRWLDEAAFADVIALCQFLPGPASSQVGLSIGIMRAGLPGALAAWLGFTMPSALLLTAFGYGVGRLGDLSHAAWLDGLRIVAVAVVANALWGMARNLCPDATRATIAVAAAITVLNAPSSAGQVGAIIGGGLIGWWILQGADVGSGAALGVRIPRAWSWPAGILFFALLFGLPLLAAAVPNQALAEFASFYRSGALVFGGGHVVLPLLQAAVVSPGWVSNDAFLAGYGAAQAVPGPLFTFSAYLGAVMGPAPHGWLGALICLVAIFLPSPLLLVAALPYWNALRRQPAVQSALRGVNAAVVGILLAALYTPVWTSAILSARDFAIGIAAFLLLAVWAVPPWLVVVLGAAAAAMLAAVIG